MQEKETRKKTGHCHRDGWPNEWKRNERCEKETNKKQEPRPRQNPKLNLHRGANKETRKVLKEIIEQIHKEGEIPHSWEEGEMINLYKGKGLNGKCSNKRGIRLASNVGKLYERIINERVKKQVTVTKAQAGGKPECSTMGHLIVLK